MDAMIADRVPVGYIRPVNTPTPPIAVAVVPPVKSEFAATAAEAIEKPLSTLSKLTDEILNFFVAKGPAVVGALVIFTIAWIASKWVRQAVIAGLIKANLDPLLAKFFANTARWAVLAFAVVTCLGTLGFETTSLAAVIGAMGLAIGLALQGNLGNLAAGVLLLIFRPFQIGDSVVVAGQAGVIDGIDLFTTNLDTADNRRIIIPNSAIFGGVIENQSHHPRRSVTVNIATSVGLDADKTRAILSAMMTRFAAETPGALRDPAPAVALAEITPNVVWSVTVWAETSKFAGIRPALLERIKQVVDDEALAPPPPVQLIKQT
jgi:small conductance mechanosensitive channel